MNRRLDGKVALVTGAAGGLGSMVARRLVERGVRRLALADLASGPLSALADELAREGAETLALPCDLAVPAECERIVAETDGGFGGVDVGIHTAAAAPEGLVPFLEVSDELWRSEVALNLSASFFFGRALARRMVERNGGAIIYTGSIASLGAGRGMSAYHATKTGIVGLVRAMAIDLGDRGVRVNMVSPGAIDTPRYRRRVPSEDAIAGFRREFSPAPLNRIGTPREIADAFVYLASEEATHITGHNLVVDGGTTAQMRTPDD